jgi:hypothetical protein
MICFPHCGQLHSHLKGLPFAKEDGIERSRAGVSHRDELLAMFLHYGEWRQNKQISPSIYLHYYLINAV